MANWSTLKAAIANAIKTNGNQEITGQLLQNVLNNIVSSVGEHATYAGIATPTTNPGAPDGPVFYFATQAGIYSNFGGLSVDDGEVAVLKYNGSAWSKDTTGIASEEKVTELENTKQDKLTFDNIPTIGSSNPVTSGGVRYALDMQKSEVDKAKEEAIQAINENEQSAITNFNSQRVTPEMLSESTKQLIEASGGGTINNLPDDEDLTSQDNGTGINVLKLANRSYNPTNFSGKGYKIIRKNIVDSKNVLTQDMLNDSSTVYEIRYDFDLNGAEIIIPEGCILQFNGGTLNNGNIKGNSTRIKAGISKIFSNITFKGNFIISESYPEWFGECGIEGIDDSEKIEKAISIFTDDIEGGIVKLLNIYYLSKPVLIKTGIHISGISYMTLPKKGQIYTNPDFKEIEYNQSGASSLNIKINSLFYTIGKCRISHIGFNGRATEHIGAKCGIILADIGMGQIDHCSFTRFEWCGIWSMKGTEDLTISDNRFAANGIAIRCGTFSNYILEDGNYDLYANLYKTTSKRGTSTNLVKIVNNYIIYANIGVYVDGAYDVTIQKTATGRCTIASIIFNNVRVGRIIGCYTEEDGVATYFYPDENTVFWGDNLSDDLPVSPILREKNIDGYQIDINRNVRAPYILYSCTSCIIENNSISFRKRRKITDSSVNLDLIGYCGVDSVVCLAGKTRYFTFKNNKLYQPKSDHPEIEAFNSIKNIIIAPTSILDGVSVESEYRTNNIYTIQPIAICNNLLKLFTPAPIKLSTNLTYQFLNDKSHNRFPNTEQLEYSESINGIPLFKRKSGFNDNIQFNTNKIPISDLDEFEPFYILYKNRNDFASPADFIGTLSLILYKEEKVVETLAIQGNITSYGYDYGIKGVLFNKEYKSATHFKLVYFCKSNTKGIENFEFSPVINSLIVSDFSNLNISPNNPTIGESYFNSIVKKPSWWYNGNWVDSNGNLISALESGTFEQKPTEEQVSIGFAYFCTDKQTTEGSRKGIMIYYAGDNTWVDALGRVVS